MLNKNRITWLLAAASLCIFFRTPAVKAQPVGADININAFRPALDSRGYITVNASQTLGHLEFSFGLVTNWGLGVLRFENGPNSYEVTNIITPTLVGAVGFRVGPLDLELAGQLPFGIMSGDRDPDDVGGTPSNPNDDSNFKFSGQGFSDASVHLKWRLLNTSKGPGIGLAFIGSVYLPTSTRGNWLGDREVVPQIMAVVDKEFGSTRQLRMALTGGFRYRPNAVSFVDNPVAGMPVPPSTGRTISVENSILYGFGVGYSLVPDRFEVLAEVFGEHGLDEENYLPLEGLLGLKFYLSRNSFLLLGGGTGFQRSEGANPDLRGFLGIVFEPSVGDRDGDGIKDDVDQCPDDPEDRDGFQDSDGCPELDNDEDGILDEDDDCPNIPEDKDGVEDEDGCPEGNESDRDGDGILDNVDKCPDDPEDFDQFEDEDGCPDPDNDKDGILDVSDLCINEPEDKDNFEDKDGCPDLDNDRDRIVDVDDKCPRVDGETAEETAEVYNGKDDEDGCPDRGRVVVNQGAIEILDKIYFEYNSDVIKKRSYKILDTLVATLKALPEIKLVEVQGHTDERGSNSYNQDLSNRRAASVKRYLVNGGIEENRLESQGYGETQPLIRKSNEAAWAENRRVEFLILKRE